jgi:hypothetical protein
VGYAAIGQDNLEAALQQLLREADRARGVGVDRRLDPLDLLGNVGGIECVRDRLGVGQAGGGGDGADRAGTVTVGALA